MNKTSPSSLHSTIRSRLDQLQLKCRELCGNGASRSGATAPHEPLHEFFSSVQLWKERSLHRALESLDKAAGAASTDSHVEAMEDHEKAAKDLFELARVLLDRTWHGMNLQLEGFAEDLAALVDSIVGSRLEEQRQVHASVVGGLKVENRKLARTCQELHGVNAGLEERLQALENAPDAGGDAILCHKLRARVQHLVIRQHELSVELERAAEERVKHRRELEKTKALLAEAQKSLALTRAMQEKETRQLAALAQLNHAHLAQVLEASSEAAADPRRHQHPLESNVATSEATGENTSEPSAAT
ncbi:hypothetical protein PHYPSEUDO_013822 [Phytophthora pseudosyringae]|uniref:Uncharacterized protein n=1 Tax=Phytophthora pseudosyringae TaxID=221518 RepID=A0A8T1W2R6_9STRA|nr:hypothetical protein PHYPSEUDO_013822 [Phytophthora pseudosyringae]